MKDYLVCLSDVIHSLQGERGLSTLFIREPNPHNKNQLSGYLLETDAQLTELGHYIKKWQSESELKTDQLELVSNITFHLDKLQTQRQLTLKHQSSATKIFEFYTFGLVKPLIQLMSSFVLRIKNLHPNAVSAFVFFIQWKEKVGLERLMLIRGFVEHKFDDEYQEHIESLLSEQNYYEKSFLSLATLEQQEIVKSTYEVPDALVLEKIHQAVTADKQHYITEQINAKDWFELISNKLQVMHTVEYELILNLDQKHRLFTKDTIQELDVEQRLVYKLAIFNDMPAYEVNHIVSNGEIYQIPKNKLIMLENNIATHLHIILVGWVKVFKATANGKETILQMLSSGHSIMESCIFSNTCLKANAKTASDVLMFSIPTAVVKQQIKLNNQFALNLLGSIANKTVELAHEIEAVKTQSAEQRIGYFLLQLMNQKKWISNKLKLPYNKSIVASQLGISREAFSRLLTQLDKQKIQVDKNNITLENKFNLCQYCDSSITESCQYYGKKECAHQESYSGKIGAH